MFVEIRTEYLHQVQLLPFVVYTVGENSRQKIADRPNGFLCHHVLIVEEGEGYFRLNGEVFPVSAGNGVFCRAGVPHAYGPTGSSFRTLWVTFRGGEGALDYYQLGDSFCFKASPMLCSATRSLYEFCCANSTVLTRSAAGYSWLTEWLHGCFSPSASLETQVRGYLETHFAEPLTLDQVAEAVHMSRYALCHRYKKISGMTVMDQLKKIRIAKARQLLQFSTAAVEEISRSCGFESPSYFGKLFRQETGRAPREYRALHQSGQIKS